MTLAILNAVAAYRDSLMNPDYFDLIAEADLSNDGKAAVQAARELVAEGERYHAEGYRALVTRRTIVGVSIRIPFGALASRDVDAGHFNTSAMHRCEYLVKEVGQ